MTPRGNCGVAHIGTLSVTGAAKCGVAHTSRGHRVTSRRSAADGSVQACGTRGITFSVGHMTERAPIHLGSGEPILLLHPFMMSQSVWKKVAPLIAETGRYEVFAPTMAGHNGGAKGPFF